MGTVYNKIFKKELITPKTTPLHQGAYEQGDAFVPDMSNQVMMQGLQTLGANAAKAYNNPRARGEGQLSRAEKRDRRGVRKGEGTMKTDATGKFNYEANDVNSKFNAKTSKIRKRGEANIERADIDTKYKAWMINQGKNNQNNTSGANPQGVAGVNTTGNTGNTGNTGISNNNFNMFKAAGDYATQVSQNAKKDLDNAMKNILNYNPAISAGYKRGK